ncbi:unnamed protein product, partial [Polarella glacialis]
AFGALTAGTGAALKLSARYWIVLFLLAAIPGYKYLIVRQQAQFKAAWKKTMSKEIWGSNMTRDNPCGGGTAWKDVCFSVEKPQAAAAPAAAAAAAASSNEAASSS